MGLRGDVQDFGLPDLLQLIAKGHKSGMLVLDNRADEVTVWIREGWVLDVETDRPTDAKLGTRLQRTGMLTHAELGQALKRRAESNDKLAEVLVKLSFATAETVRQYATLLAIDLLYECFTWKSGSYSFDEGPIEDGPPWIEPMDVEQVLMQGIVLIDEWAMIQERVPSVTWLVADQTELPPDQELGSELMFPTDETTESDHPLVPGPNERLVHELAVPGTDVQMLIDRAPFSRFETCRCLSVLVGANYLTLIQP